MVATPQHSEHLILLSGPTSGLGYEIFKLLLGHGYPLVCLGRKLGRLQAIPTRESAQVEFLELDFGGNKESWLKVQDRLQSLIRVGRPPATIFISNAAVIEPIGKSSDNSMDILRQAAQINILTPLMIANTLAQAVSLNGSPLLIINIDSGASRNPVMGWQAYCATKAAYRMGLDVLALENPLVEVLHYEPGAMDTPMQNVIRTKKKSQMPDVENFKVLHSQGLLAEPHGVAVDIVAILERRLL